RLRRIASRRETPRRPALRDSERLPRRRFIRGRGDAMIERHHDIAPDGLLRLDAHLRTEQDRLAVEITLKDRAFFAHRTRMGQRENLESTGVRQHRALPAHETVNPSGAAKDFGTGAKQEVVSIREEDLSARV